MEIKTHLLVLGCFILVLFSIPKNIQKKVDKVIKVTFETEEFILDPIVYSNEIVALLPADFSQNNFFRIQQERNQLGYAYISKAPSKTDYFDYLIILDNDLLIRSSKVLAYREDYGGEIGSKRWLKQLVGKTPGDKLIYGDNIAAISGATISVRSMTNAVNQFLSSIKILNAKQKL